MRETVMSCTNETQYEDFFPNLTNPLVCKLHTRVPGPTGLYYVPLSFLGSFTVGLLQMSPILTFLTLSVILMGQIVGKNEGWSRGDALYFSFVTATTVGYGDLRPTKTSSKALAVGISFVGLVFTGIVAAIGLHSAQHAFESTQPLATL